MFEAERVGKNSSVKNLKVLEINMERKQIIDHNKGENISDCLWMQLVQPHMYYLSVGEVFRFGKQKLIVRSMKTKSGKAKGETSNPINRIKIPETSIPEDNKKAARMITLEEQESVDQGNSCRICLDGPTSSDPFVNICPCSKRMPIHLSCVKEWLKKKVKKTRKNNVVYCNLQEIKCELCNTDYPAKVLYQNKEHSLLDFQLEEDKPHILLDICCRDTGVNKGFVVIYFEGTSNKYTVGRGQANDIVFNDTSVSREHAFLNYDENGISIIDRGAKYGTLVKTNAYNYGPFKERFFIQIDKFLFEVHSFKGAKCDCKIERSMLIKDNPFKAIPEVERNSFLVLDKGNNQVGVNGKGEGRGDRDQPAIDIRTGTLVSKPTHIKKEGFLEFGAFKKNKQMPDREKADKDYYSILKSKEPLDDHPPRKIQIEENLSGQKLQNSGFMEKMGLLENLKSQALDKHKGDRMVQNPLNPNYLSSGSNPLFQPLVNRDLLEQKRANQENRNMPTAIRVLSPMIDSMRFMSTKPDLTQQTRETLISQVELQKGQKEANGQRPNEFSSRSKSEAVLKNCQIISFHNRLENSRNGVESVNESIRVQEKLSHKVKLETSVSSSHLMKQSDSWLLKNNTPLIRKSEGPELGFSQNKRLDGPFVIRNVSTDQLSVSSKEKLSLTSKYMSFSRTVRETPVPNPTPFQRMDLERLSKKVSLDSMDNRKKQNQNIKLWPEDPYGFSETSDDNFRFY